MDLMAEYAVQEVLEEMIDDQVKDAEARPEYQGSYFKSILFHK